MNLEPLPEELCGGGHVVHLATLRSDGAPQSRPLWTIVHEGTSSLSHRRRAQRPETSDAIRASPSPSPTSKTPTAAPGSAAASLAWSTATRLSR